MLIYLSKAIELVQ